MSKSVLCCLIVEEENYREEEEDSSSLYRKCGIYYIDSLDSMCVKLQKSKWFSALVKWSRSFTRMWIHVYVHERKDECDTISCAVRKEKGALKVQSYPPVVYSFAAELNIL